MHTGGQYHRLSSEALEIGDWGCRFWADCGKLVTCPPCAKPNSSGNLGSGGTSSVRKILFRSIPNKGLIVNSLARHLIWRGGGAKSWYAICWRGEKCAHCTSTNIKACEMFFSRHPWFVAKKISALLCGNALSIRHIANRTHYLGGQTTESYFETWISYKLILYWGTIQWCFFNLSFSFKHNVKISLLQLHIREYLKFEMNGCANNERCWEDPLSTWHLMNTHDELEGKSGRGGRYIGCGWGLELCNRVGST